MAPPQQLNFPTDYIMPPHIPYLADIPGLDQIYILTIKSKYPDRYERAVKIAKGNSITTIWEGIPTSQLTKEHENLVDFDKVVRLVPGYTHDTHYPKPDDFKHARAVSFDHLLIWRDAYQKGYNKVLILEDDAIFSKDFSARLTKSAMLDSYHLTYLGMGCVLHDYSQSIEQSPGVYLRPDCASRCTDSYLINREALTILVKHFEPPGTKMRITIDHFLHWIALFYNFKVAWIEPTYVKQGSLFRIKF